MSDILSVQSRASEDAIAFIFCLPSVFFHDADWLFSLIGDTPTLEKQADKFCFSIFSQLSSNISS